MLFNPQVAKASIIVGDPSYFTATKTRKNGRVVRSICILDHPIANTDNSESVQIIIPASQVGRRNDIYVCMVSSAHQVAAQGMYIAIVSTTVETADPLKEVGPGVALLGKILERYRTFTFLISKIESRLSFYPLDFLTYFVVDLIPCLTCLSQSRMARTTTASSPSPTTPRATSRRRPTMSCRCTSASRARSST